MTAPRPLPPAERASSNPRRRTRPGRAVEPPAYIAHPPPAAAHSLCAERQSGQGVHRQRHEPDIKLYNYNARWYDHRPARFLQPYGRVPTRADVPAPGDPQSLNRYAYTGNNPLRYTDPSGQAPQYPGDPDPNNAPCSTEWCWKNRWYRAHGYSWTGHGWALQGADAVFYDEAILQDTMAELGIGFTNFTATWTFSEMTLVAQGVVALANKIGSFERLRNRLPFGASFWRATHALFYYYDQSIDPPAHTIPGANLVVFDDSLFQQAADFVRGTAVHELAHAIDYFNPIDNNYIHQVVPTGTHISNYAVANRLGLEYWAEAVAVWVYGGRYQSVVPDPELNAALTVSQNSWIERVLKGWGW